jgi:hypothetical protein
VRVGHASRNVANPLPHLPAPGSSDERNHTTQLSDQTRIDITRWAQEYISGLVENHHGDR